MVLKFGGIIIFRGGRFEDVFVWVSSGREGWRRKLMVFYGCCFLGKFFRDSS